MCLEQSEFSKKNSCCHISPADLALMNDRAIQNSSKAILRVSAGQQFHEDSPPMGLTTSC